MFRWNALAPTSSCRMTRAAPQRIGQPERKQCEQRDRTGAQGNERVAGGPEKHYRDAAGDADDQWYRGGDYQTRTDVEKFRIVFTLKAKAVKRGGRHQKDDGERHRS